jgi:hypothetical protein
MTIRFWAILSLVLVLGFSRNIARGDSYQPFDRSEYQFPLMFEGQIYEYTIPLKNISKNPVLVLSVLPDCVYLEASIDKTFLLPGETAMLTARIDANGNLGKIAKTVSISTSAASDPYILTIRGSIVHREYDRDHVQTIFKDPCAKCHVGTNIGDKEGQQIYDAVCYPCHKDSFLIVRHEGPAFLSVVRSGIPGALMPGFAVFSGGPLNDHQIDSLAGFLGF